MINKFGWAGCLLGVLLSANALAEAAFPNRIQGDLGGMVNMTQSAVRGDGTRPMLLPYAYCDYGRVFARIDTFGIKTLPMGYGYLEVVGRVKFDGYSISDATRKGIGDRQNSVPLGIGSFQLTPIGGFFLYAFYDANQSHGGMFEAVYAAELEFGTLTVYPEIGVEHYSPAYTRYYYGVSAAEAAASGYAAYAPAAATNPMLNVMLEVPLADGWIANLYLQRKWMDTPIGNSPLVDRKCLDSGFVAVAFHFD